MKKIILFIILLLPISIKASESFIVMDADSLRVLGGKNINEELLIASTTKLMTSLVALENSETTDVLCAGEEILSVYGSMIYIDQNECMTLYDLLMGLNLRSGNDAAMVIATHTIGYANFINEMNNMSSKLGLNNTHFSNPHGLDNKTKNTSTAYDLGLLMSYLTKNKTFMNITGTKKYTLTSSKETHIWYNKNELLNRYKFTTGGKTGYTDKSGYIFVSSASKGEENLVIVTMKEKDRFNTHKKLYEDYFKTYDSYKVVNKNTFNVNSKYYKKYHLYVKEDIKVMLKTSELNKVKYDIKLVKKKNVKDNEKVGILKVYIGKEYVGKTNIYIISKENKEKSIKSKLFFWKK